jgi:cytochrome c-type biogenesis protein CcmH/NrfF
VRLALAAVALAALAFAAPALASEAHPTLEELEGEVMCPTCHTTLDRSDSPIAERIEAFIQRRIDAGDTKSQIKDKLVANFGEGILAAPPKSGFGLLAWLLPIGGGILAAVAIGYGAWKWSSGREPEAAVAAGPPLDPELERRLDAELRAYDG